MTVTVKMLVDKLKLKVVYGNEELDVYKRQIQERNTCPRLP